eukprot:11315329-Alexandrium_andersonii.AAC.1
MLSHARTAGRPGRSYFPRVARGFPSRPANNSQYGGPCGGPRSGKHVRGFPSRCRRRSRRRLRATEWRTPRQGRSKDQASGP